MRRGTSGIEGISIADTWANEGDRSRRRFLARVKLPGTAIYKARRFDTRKEAKQWGDKWLAELKAGTDTAEDADLVVVSAEYIRQLRESIGPEGGTTEYMHHIGLVVEGLAKAGIRDMKAKTFGANVRSWIANLKPNWCLKPDSKFLKTSGKPLSNTTRNRIIREVRCLCHHAVSTRRITYNALEGVKKFTETKTLKPTFSLSELRLMVSDKARFSRRNKREEAERAIADAGGDYPAAAKALGIHLASLYNWLALPKDVGEDPWWLPCCLMVYTGCRVQEAMHLRWQDIDWESRRIRVRLQEEYDQKNDTEREVPLQAELGDILLPIAKPSGFIIADPLMRSNGAMIAFRRTKTPQPLYSPAFCAYLKRIGISPGVGTDKRSAHSTRHCWVSMMLATGEGHRLVAQWAGHGVAVQEGYSHSTGRYNQEASAWARGRITLRSPIDSTVNAVA